MTQFPKAGQTSFTGWPGAEPSEVDDSSGGRFKKGTSGNPKGRPIKAVRAVTVRGMHKDIIDEAERSIDVNGEKMPAIRLLLRQLFHDAVKGDRNARSAFLKFYQQALEKLVELNPEENRHLEFLEKHVNNLGSFAGNETLKMLNDAREKAKKI